jgi:hypothetical protein
MKTNNSTHTLFLCSLTAIFSLFLLTITARAADPGHLFWAEDIAAKVTPDKNMYDTNPSYIHWPDVNGVGVYENRTKCAPFITQVLMQAYGWTSTYFRNWMSSTSPTATEYYDTIKRQNRFVIIDNINSIQPGDIIAIKYPSGSIVTGHMMMANGPATLRSSTLPFVTGTVQYEIQVIDSSQTGHGPTDTRLMEDGTYGPGAGIGIFRLYTNNAGVIKGYTWSTYNNSQYYDLNTRPIIVGRLM